MPVSGDLGWRICWEATLKYQVSLKDFQAVSEKLLLMFSIVLFIQVVAYALQLWVV